MNLHPSLLSTIALTLALTAAPSGAAAGFDENRLSATVLADKLQRPLELDVAPDGRVFFIELEGSLKIFHPQTGGVSEAAKIQVFAQQEAGLIGLTLDPDFANNHWLYLMYSPPTETFVGEYVSRFTMQGDLLDRDSERVVLKIPTHRDDCCHHAGSLEFGPRGNLFISTGDNTHPGGDSGGFAPIDEREGRHVFDAQDTAGNTDDLRGKILRIHPTTDGGYTIPPGNLFPEDGPIRGRPEIFVMGCRNPWRMNVDQETGFVYWGEVGPDAGGEGTKGPRGYDELNQARAAGNFGWPFFIANNLPYADHDYTTGKTGPLYDAENPVNLSPTNTGSKLLPKPQPAWIFYPYADSKEFPMLGSGGRTACAGPVYHFDPDLDSATKLPRDLDNNLIIFDWHRTFIKRVQLDTDSNIVSIEPFLTAIPIKRPTDMRIGPDGSLYLLDYGSTWGVNEDARLLRIDYHATNRPPVAKISTQPGTAGKQPFSAKLSALASTDPDPGDKLSFHWSVDHGDFPAQDGETAQFLFEQPGTFVVTLKATDAAGSEASDTVTLSVGNSPPGIRFVKPVDGGFFEWGDEISYEIAVDDAEDGTSTENSDTMRSRLLVNHFIGTLAPGTEEAAYLSGAGEHAAGLAMVQQSDCLNCHAVDRRIVGPSFREVALRYAPAEDQPAAVHASAARIIQGSSKVWGEIPMLPHAQFSPEQAAVIVRWIYSLDGTANNGEATSQNFTGTTMVVKPGWMKQNTSGAAAVWRASFTDFGASGAAPLTAKTEVRLHPRQLEAEHFSRRNGTQTLASQSASGGQFVGDISSGQHLFFDHINLAGIKSVSARVASPATAGSVQLRQGSPDGKLIAELAFAPTGAWETWIEVNAPISDPGGINHLCVVFVNPTGSGAFMNLDRLDFR